MSDFRKRTVNFSVFVRSLVSAVLHLPVLVAALLIPSTSRALREKVMLAVTSVTDCRYCSYLHTGLALANGVDLDELQQLLASGTLDSVDQCDAVAILFAQHFADTVRRPSDAAREALARHFNAYQRIEIMAYIHAIYFANLSANSFDAWLARLSGRKVADGHPFPEAIAAMLATPLVTTIALIAWLSKTSQQSQSLSALPVNNSDKFSDRTAITKDGAKPRNKLYD